MALALDLTDAGFDSSVLCEFRSRLIAGNAERLLFETILSVFREHGLITAKGRQRTDSTHVLAAIRALSRLELLGETVRATLNALATQAPKWLQQWVPSAWFARYRHRSSDYRLPAPTQERAPLAEQIGNDGRTLLTHLYDPATPAERVRLPAVPILRHVWLQQFYAVAPDQAMQTRTPADVPPSSLVMCSPFDADARYRSQRKTEWRGYSVHLTESCDDDGPHLITHGETTPATTADNLMTGIMHAGLLARTLAPGEQLLDAGYVTSDHLVRREAPAMTLRGPVIEDQRWQARGAEGFGAAPLVIDWEAEHARCPQGKQSTTWKPMRDRKGHDVISIRFAHTDGCGCPVRAPWVKTKQPRALMVRTHAHDEALRAARARQHTEVFKQQYQKRAGRAGTLSQAVRAQDLRRSRDRGLLKTRLVHIIIAAALNFMRVAAWLAEQPRQCTRRSSFAKRAPHLVEQRVLAQGSQRYLIRRR